MTFPQNNAGQWLVCTGNDVEGSSPAMSSTNDNAPSPLPADGVSKRKQGMYSALCFFFTRLYVGVDLFTSLNLLLLPYGPQTTSHNLALLTSATISTRFCRLRPLPPAQGTLRCPLSRTSMHQLPYLWEKRLSHPREEKASGGAVDPRSCSDPISASPEL